MLIVSELLIITNLNQHQKDVSLNRMEVGMMTEEVDSCWRELWNEIGL